MFVKLQLHGQFKDTMPKGKKRPHVVYANKVDEILTYLSQYPAVKELLKANTFELRLGQSIKKSRSLHPDELARASFSEGATLHLCPPIGGQEITTAMIITALITAAATAVATILTQLFFPVNQDEEKEGRKGQLYEGGVVVQKENEPLYYIGGLDVGCGGNLIEGGVYYMNTGNAYSSPSTKAEELFGEPRDQIGYGELRGRTTGIGGDKGGGGRTISNTLVSDATMLGNIALGDGPIGGVVGTTKAEKEKNIYINRQPLRDHGTNNLTYQGTQWEERIGEEGQTPIMLVPGVINNVDANVDLPKLLSGGSQFYHEVLVQNPKADKAQVRLACRALLDTDNKKGNQEVTTIKWGFNVKRENASTWASAGTYSYTGKTTDPIVLERVINAPAAATDPEEKWQFQIYRITPDSTSDKLQNDTAFNGHMEIQSIELAYDGSETTAPTAQFAIAIDLAQFSQGGNYPEILVRCAGRKVRVPVNYDPVTRTYTGPWNGSWKTAATQNPVWHWLHIATETLQGLGIADDFFNRFELYDIAKFNDEDVNGRPRYTLNKQFREVQDGWPLLVQLASSFRAFPYFDGSHIVLVQDRPNQAISHYVNNTMVEDGIFNYQNVELSKQFNEVLVKYNDPDDYFLEKSVRYRDTESIERNRDVGLAAGGVIRATFEKFGCTNKQEAYDFARMLVFVSQKENVTVTFNTLLGAAAYAPGQLIEIDDVIVANKQFFGRAAGVTEGGILLEKNWLQEANESYDAHLVINNELEVRPVEVVTSDTSHNIVACDTTDVEWGTPLGIVQEGGAQPRVFRIVDIADQGNGKYTVTAKLHVEGKYAYIEEDVPVPEVPYSDLRRKSYIPAPTGLQVTHSFNTEDSVGSQHRLRISWDRNNDPQYALKGYKVEVFKPDTQWHLLYEGMMNVATLEGALAGRYVFSVKPVNTFGVSGEPASIEYVLEYGQSGSSLNPPVFVGFD